VNGFNVVYQQFMCTTVVVISAVAGQSGPAQTQAGPAHRISTIPQINIIPHPVTLI